MEGTGGVRTTVLPKLIDINIGFSPLHEKTLGYGKGASVSGFPYGLKNDRNKVIDENGFDYGFTDEKSGRAFSVSEQKVPIIYPRGMSLSELRAIKDTLEEKRRKAASAQQSKDKELAAYRKAERKISRKQRRGKISELEADTQRFEQADGLSDLVNNASNLSEELQNIEDLLG